MSPVTKATIPQALQQARQHFHAGRFDQVESICQQILQVDPAQPTALHMLGLLKLGANLAEQATEWLRRAEAANPRDAAVKVDLGNAFMVQRQYASAIASYQSALALNPDDGPAYCNLGIALNETGQVDESIETFRKSVTLAPRLAAGHNNLGHALRKLGRLDEALAALNKAVALRPDWADIHNNLANVHRDSGRIEQAVTEARLAVHYNPRYAVAHSNLLMFMHFDPTCDAKVIFDEHRRWNQAHAMPLSRIVAPHTNDRSPDRRLRIGYVSPDMRDHAVSYFFEPLLASHDPEQVETFCYAELWKPDHVSERLQKHSHNWLNAYGFSDEKLAARVRDDRIDILIDLAGHTAGNRLLAFARKPAPIQITYLGYPDTTGLSAIEYRMVDAFSDPAGMTEAFHSEQLIRLPDTFLCYRPADDAPGVSPSPFESAGRITFGSFNVLPKINLPLVELWAEILRQVPNSKMLLKTGNRENAIARKRLVELFGACGIGPERLELRDRIPTYVEHLKLYEQVDVALDAFPYHGTTTSCEALWMGVPMVTLAGRTHVSRVGVSILNNIGLSQLVAEDRQQYIRIAVELAGNASHLRDLRAGMRQRMKQSPLMNAPQFARNVEQAYRSVWRQWCGATDQR